MKEVWSALKGGDNQYLILTPCRSVPTSTKLVRKYERQGLIHRLNSDYH